MVYEQPHLPGCLQNIFHHETSEVSQIFPEHVEYGSHRIL
jgi:hypothetical protein